MKQTYTVNELIDFVNWYIEVHKLGEAYKLENRNLIVSFNSGQEPSKWYRSENDNTELIRVPSEMVDIVQSFVEERKSQDKKWGVLNFDPIKWNSILMEKVGEVVKASWAPARSGDMVENLIEKLIQTGADTMAYIDYLKRREQENENADNVFLDDLKRVIEESNDTTLHAVPMDEVKEELNTNLKSVLDDLVSLSFRNFFDNLQVTEPKQRSIAVIALDLFDFQDWVEENKLGVMSSKDRLARRFTNGYTTYYCVVLNHDCISKRFNHIAETKRAKENRHYQYLLDMCTTHCKQS